MIMADPELLRLLGGLLPLPTAPFHEGFVSGFLREKLTAAAIEFAVDRCGNIVASTGGAPALALVAHMDHPGFEIIGASAKSAEAAWHGGVDAKYFPGARVVVYDQASGGIAARGTVRKVRKNGVGRVEMMTLRLKGAVRAGDFGTWYLTPFRHERELIHTKGADDLVGCAAILLTIKQLKAQGIPGVRGVFTRAEEEGFIGTLGMIR